MHKTKEGKVIASLTEVKNKTGDIFALVDEFGEVVLTSYNKPRYRIVKIGVADMLEEKSTQVKNPKSESKTSIVKKVVKKATEPKVVRKKEEKSLISNEILEQLKKLAPWNKNSKKEKNYISSIKSPLQ